MAANLLRLSTRFTDNLQRLIEHYSIPPSLLSLPPHLRVSQLVGSLASPTSLQTIRATPIIPVFTSSPRPLSAHLRSKGMNARPITWPTVPKGLDRVRVCLHAGNTEEEVDSLAQAMVEWARNEMESTQRKQGSRVLGLQSKL